MYYPKQRYSSELTRIRRQATLPAEALGNIQVEVGQTVDIRDKVARGLIPARHVILEAAHELGIRPDQLGELMLVNPGNRVETGQALAGRDATRGRRVLAPFPGVVIYVGEGQIIMQEMPQLITLEAGVRGRITEVIEGRGVVIQATGAVLQGVWGNDRNAIATIRMEPERGGIESINPESLDTTHKNEIVITRSPLTSLALDVGLARGFAGIIAPSMDANLLDTVLATPYAVMLTGGFGDMRMSSATAHFFSQFDGSQAMLDAAQTQRFTERRAELVINRPTNQQVPDVTAVQPIEVGSEVRITRDPHFGVVGTVEELPPNPVMLENGLRVKIAVVELIAGEYVDVPLANLELAGT
jgi:transcription elongation GreA/GreB family factor